MSHDNYDDGLVHSHDWAREPPRAPMKRQQVQQAQAQAQPAEDFYDDGLVHSHDWARSAPHEA